MAKKSRSKYVASSKKEILEQRRKPSKGLSVEYDVIQIRAKGAQIDPKDSIILFTVEFDAGKLDIKYKGVKYHRVDSQGRIVAPHEGNDPVEIIRQIVERRLKGGIIPPPGEPKRHSILGGRVIPPPGGKRKKR